MLSVYEQLSLIERFSLGWDVLSTRFHFHQLNIKDSLIHIFRQIDDGHGSQETEEVISILRQVRLQLASHWLMRLSLEAVTASYQEEYSRAQELIPVSGIKDEPMTEEEQYFLEDISTCVMNRGFTHSLFMRYFLILMLYYYPHQFPENWYEGVSMPDWFMDDFLRFLLVNPQQFNDQDDAENYYNYAFSLMNYLHGRIIANKDSNVWQSIGKFIGANANFYLLNDSGKDLSQFQQQFRDIYNLYSDPK